jgi:O-antigen ligase
MFFLKKNAPQFLAHLIFLLPITLVAGVAITEIFVFIICVYFLFYCIRFKVYKYFKSNFFLFFLFIYFFLILNSLLSQDYILSIKTSIPYVRYGILSLAIWFAYENYFNFLKKLKIYFYSFYFLLVFDGFFQFVFGNNIVGYSTDSGRLSSFFFSEWILGSFLQKFYPIFLLLLINSKNFLKFYNLVFLLLVYILVYYTGERAAFYLLSLYISLNIYFYFTKKNFIKISLLFFFLFIIFYFTGSYERMFVKYKNLENQNTVKIFYKDTYQNYHLTAYKIFLDNKFFGSGLKTFRILCNNKEYSSGENSCSTHPHNYYIQVLAECGLIGFTILLSVFLFFFYKYIKLAKSYLMENKKKCLTKIVIISALVVQFWPLATTGNFFNNFLSIILYYLIGFYLKNEDNSKIIK